MPKREPAALPASDDTHFFTIVNPYPNQPHVSDEDSRIFARWIACIVGQDSLLAFYHKPKSPNTVIIELSKDTCSTRALLGRHQWSEFLNHSRGHDLQQASCIFPCTMSNPWSLDKVRWLRCDIKSSWFRHWSPSADSTIAYPYPRSHYCRPPVEDITRTALCKPFPPEFLLNDSQHAHDRPILALRSAAPTVLTEAHMASLSDSASDYSDGFLSTTLHHLPQFAPAIHGTDAPKNATAFVDVGIAAPPAGETLSPSLWPGYGEEPEHAAGGAAEAEAPLCTAHGVLCSSGICKVCGARKRAAVREERARRRQEHKDVHARSRAKGGRVDPSPAAGSADRARSSLPAHLRTGAPRPGIGTSLKSVSPASSVKGDDTPYALARGWAAAVRTGVSASTTSSAAEEEEEETYDSGDGTSSVSFSSSSSSAASLSGDRAPFTGRWGAAPRRWADLLKDEGDGVARGTGRPGYAWEDVDQDDAVSTWSGFAQEPF